MNPSEVKTESEQFLDSYRKILHSFALPHRLSGQYTLLNCIKHSAQKEIYLLSGKGKNLYVLKRERNSENTRIRQEHRIFMLLKESLIPVSTPECVDYWEEEDWCYLLRTYIEGDSLDAYSDKHPLLAKQEITAFSLEICRLVKALHDQKPPIIHRDIKPENFVVQKKTHALFLIDFDTARQYIPEKMRDTRFVGTPDLAAPEQFGFYQSDVRTDIYGIGKTMLYLMSGNTSADCLQDKAFPRRLRRIISRAAAFSPEKRYPDVTALQKDLQRYQRQLSLFHILHRPKAIGAALFFVGFCTGLATGMLYHKNPDAVLKPSVYTDEAAPSKQTFEQPEEIRHSPDSLLSISDAKQIDFWQYQNQVDSIILSCYHMDYDTMTTQLEALVHALYADEALMQLPDEDYSTYDSLPPDFWNMSALSTIRLRLAYRNQILHTNLGSYEKYQKNITDMLRNSLSLVSRDDTPSALYQYATLPAEKRNEHYTFALSDILAEICSAFDIADNFDTPTHENPSEDNP